MCRFYVLWWMVVRVRAYNGEKREKYVATRVAPFYKGNTFVHQFVPVNVLLLGGVPKKFELRVKTVGPK